MSYRDMMVKENNMLVLECPYTFYSPSICEARRFTEEEKKKYSDWYKEHGFVATGEHIYLPFLRWEDFPKRDADGEFLGCSNRAWIITEEESEFFIRLNAEREAAKKAAEEKERAEYEARKAEKERERQAVFAKFTSWERQKTGKYEATHTMTINGETLRFVERDIFDVGVVINPLYSVADGLEPGGLALKKKDTPTLYWNIYMDGSLVSVRPLTENEMICYRAIAKYGEFNGIRM